MSSTFLAGRKSNNVNTEGVSSPSKKRKKKKTPRKKLYELHSWFGFHIAVLMFVVVASGTIAVVSNELDWLVNSQMRVSPGENRVGWQTMVDAIESSAPGITVAGIGGMGSDYFAYRATTFNDRGEVAYTYVNQWTGEVTGQTSLFTIQYFFRNFHRYLFLPKVIGLTLVTLMAVVLAISLYTGLKTVRNWGTVMTRIRFSKGVRVAVGDAHKSIGLWSIWFFVLIIATGFWYYAEYLGENFEPEYTRLTAPERASFGDIMPDLNVDEIVAAALIAYPELHITGMSFSVDDAPIRVNGTRGNPIVRERANRVYLNPVTLEVMRVQRSSDLGWVQWINQIIDPLHFGSFGGLAVKLIWFTFGLFMTGLSASGVWLTWRRLRQRKTSALQVASIPVVYIALLIGALNYAAMQLPIGKPYTTSDIMWFVSALVLATTSFVSGLLLWRQFRRKPCRARQRRRRALALIVVLGCSTSGGLKAHLMSKSLFERKPERSLGIEKVGVVTAELFLVLDKKKIAKGEIHLLATTETGKLNLSRTTLQLQRDGLPFGKAIEKPARAIAIVQSVRAYFDANELVKADSLTATFQLHSGSEYLVTWPLESAAF